MKILYIVPYVPNLIRVRPHNLIRGLARRGHQVTLATLWGDEAERASLAQIEPYVHAVVSLEIPRWRSVWNCLAALPTRKPLQTVYSWHPELAHKLQELVHAQNGRPFDAVHVEHLRGAAYGLHLRSCTSLPVIWDSVDSISFLFRQAVQRSKTFISRGITRFELGRTESYEGWLLNQFSRVTVTSPADRQALLTLLPPGSPQPAVEVIPNGVDLDYFKPGPERERIDGEIVLSGKMSYHANVTMVLNFVEQVMPLVWSRRPDARLTVVGKDPVREVQALGEHPKITITGTVEHLPPYLQRASVAAAPIAYGAGIQNKVLEAMACGTPVVASPQAVAALSARAGKELLVASRPDEMAEAILRLLEDPAYRRQIGDAGRRYVEREHHWDHAAARLEAIYASAQGELLQSVVRG